MYYRLKEPYAFRGWKKLPYAICAMKGSQLFEPPRFFDKEVFLDMLYFNGQEDVDPSTLSEGLQALIQEMCENDVLEKSEEMMEPLQSWQRYHVYPSRHMDAVHWSITGKCNFRCRHCLVSAPTACHPQLPFEDCLKIMDEIARCGIHQVDITGGEPLVRRDYEEFFKKQLEEYDEVIHFNISAKASGSHNMAKQAAESFALPFLMTAATNRSFLQRRPLLYLRQTELRCISTMHLLPLRFFPGLFATITAAPA